MTKDPRTVISTFSADDIASHVRELGALLHACVHAGASVGFVLPFTQDDGEAFWWSKVLPAVRDGRRLLLVGQKCERVAGSVQLGYDTPPNQPHRAEVSKLLVHPDFRRQGIAKALIAEVERRASRLGRRLITLDTRTGDKAEPLYTSLGYQTAGVIPGWSLDPIEPHRFDHVHVQVRLNMPTPVLVVLALAADALLAAQGPLFTRAAAYAGGLVQAATLAFATGLMALLALSVLTDTGLPRASAIARMPPWIWAGGLIGTAVVLLSIHAVPRLGAATFVAALVCGQLVAALAYDHLGALGMEPRRVGMRDLAGTVLTGLVMIAGNGRN